MRSKIRICLGAVALLPASLVLSGCSGPGPVGDPSPTSSVRESLRRDNEADNRKICPARLTGPINTPADDSVHAYSQYSDEWWYYSSHLQSDDGDREFGFAQIVYTSLDPQSGSPIQYVDATVTDIAARQYHFGGRQYAFSPATVVPNAFDFAIGTERVRGGNGRDIVHSEVVDGGSTYVVDLKLESEKTPVLHLADGYVNYYSRERMKATGTISVDGKVYAVHGDTWFDHQFGPQLIELSTVRSWTWIAAQLTGGRELLALVVNKQDGTQQYIGSYTDEDCNTTQLGEADFTVTATGSWAASEGCVYPLGWDVRVPARGVTVHVDPVIEAQDIWVPGMDRYYEGDSTVTGSHRGKAYVELFGFCAP
jgi:predicted secreted hydrolase